GPGAGLARRVVEPRRCRGRDRRLGPGAEPAAHGVGRGAGGGTLGPAGAGERGAPPGRPRSRVPAGSGRRIAAALGRPPGRAAGPGARGVVRAGPLVPVAPIGGVARAGAELRRRTPVAPGSGPPASPVACGFGMGRVGAAGVDGARRRPPRM
ncbi:MAG: hypothetical protein AVDCRST_MAG08-2320, partial [uncultured Acetobacteraceae bacterium]